MEYALKYTVDKEDFDFCAVEQIEKYGGFQYIPSIINLLLKSLGKDILTIDSDDPDLKAILELSMERCSEIATDFFQNAYAPGYWSIPCYGSIHIFNSLKSLAVHCKEICYFPLWVRDPEGRKRTLSFKVEDE